MHNETLTPTLKTFDNLYPAILQCFLIILLGYVAGRTRLIAPSQSRGLGSYVTYFALPALIFKSLAELDFGKVNWLFWSAIMVSKAIVFVVVYVFSLVLGKDLNIGRAGIFAIFATQSNDFALGYPIVLAVYKDHYPDFVQYLYLFAPISLGLLNPAGFLSLEIQTGSDAPEAQQSRLKMIWRVTKGLATNPILMMVVAGIAANFIFQQTLPKTVDSILEVLASSFSATALFYLGISMVGMFEAKSGFYFVVPALLIGAKLILTPLVMRQLVFTMEPGGADTNLTEAYSTLGFLYGTIASAPSVFLFATYYQESITIIATSLVLCTFASAPLMFITATLVMLPIATQDDYREVLQDITFDISLVGLISSLWIMLIFILGKRARRFPHEFTIQLALAQLLTVLGIIISTSITNPPYWQEILQFVVFLSGVLASRSWTAMVALGLCLVRCRSTCCVMRYRFWFYMYGWGGAILMVGLLIAATPSDLHPQDVIYMYGEIQLAVSAASLFINSIITSICLVVLYKYDRYKRGGYHGIPGADVSSESEESEKLIQRGRVDAEGDEEEDSREDHPSPRCSVTDIEDLSMGSPSIQNQMCTNSRGCDSMQRDTCRRRLWVRHLRHLKRRRENFEESERHQMGRHVLLLLLLLLSMIIGLFVCLWKIFNHSESGVSLELEFLDIVFDYGQGFFVLATFGFDTKNVIVPVINLLGFQSLLQLTLPTKSFRHLIRGKETLKLPPESEISQEVTDMCEEFKSNHLQHCIQSIVRDIRHKLQLLNNVFYGKHLVDWLVQQGLAKDRPDAVKYGQNLVICRVIEHVEQEHDFYDRQLIYRFTVDEF
ncbi:LOW QUALITY PROTEIN: lysosomal cholesterol signaling protein-like [Amphiura filiformis]|uniref:LOW QUALITY PROTEIN: lysosomal cholesterol signaling protein-like n=1 Tax=Amphiura filiformis TaxID=82378 RepID=UPI003B20EE52